MRWKAHYLAAALAPVGFIAAHHPAVAQAVAPTSALTDAYNASGRELFGELLGSPGNIVLSPYSIGSAISMVQSGARGETARQMLSVLKHTLSQPDIDAANADVLATLNSYDRSAVPPTCPAGMQLIGARCRVSPMAGGWCPPGMQREGVQCMGGATFSPSAKLLVANELVLPKPGAVAADYASLLKDKYAAELFDNTRLADVNAWVARKTEGKIDKIVDQADRAVDAVIILNAVYFKSRWASPFDEKRTKSEPFHLSSTEQFQVSMMNQTGPYALVARQGYRAIRLPYAIESLAMGLGAVARSIDVKEQAALLTALRTTVTPTVVLALPRFKVESDVNLIPPLQQAGMKLAFDGDRADFSGMTGKPASGGGGLGAFLGHLDHGAMLDLGDRLVIAPSIKDVFEKHNLIGTFAWNCSMLPSANDNWYFVNRVIDADHIQRDYMTGPTTRAWYAILDKAAEKSANEISVSGSRNGKPTDGIWRVEQNRMLQWEATFDGKKLIASGKWVATGKVMPWLNRCGD
jgi:serpin B